MMNIEAAAKVMAEMESRALDYRKHSQKSTEAAEAAEKSNDWQTPEAKARAVVQYETMAEGFDGRAREMEALSQGLFDALYDREEARDGRELTQVDGVRCVMADMWRRSREYRSIVRELGAVAEKAKASDDWRSAEDKSRAVVRYETMAEGFDGRAQEMDDLSQGLFVALHPEKQE
jgi:hypothetical protein